MHSISRPLIVLEFQLFSVSLYYHLPLLVLIYAPMFREQGVQNVWDGTFLKNTKSLGCGPHNTCYFTFWFGSGKKLFLVMQGYFTRWLLPTFFSVPGSFLCINFKLALKPCFGRGGSHGFEDGQRKKGEGVFLSWKMLDTGFYMWPTSFKFYRCSIDLHDQ